MRITFDKIEARASVVFKCAKCGKRRTRKKTFWMTANQFNRDAAGVPKSREQVAKDVQREAAAWGKGVKLCATCESA